MPLDYKHNIAFEKYGCDRGTFTMLNQKLLVSKLLLVFLEWLRLPRTWALFYFNLKCKKSMFGE